MKAGRNATGQKHLQEREERGLTLQLETWRLLGNSPFFAILIT